MQLACESVRITRLSAYKLRIRRDGAAFRLGGDATILTGCTDTICRDEDNFEVTRHRHDNRLAMSMLSRLDRMAGSPPEGSEATRARDAYFGFAGVAAMAFHGLQRCWSDRAEVASRRDFPAASVRRFAILPLMPYISDAIVAN